MIFLSQLIRQIPIAVLFGVFLYLGIISLFSGIQFMEQLRLFFTPRKYHPNKRYIYMVSLFSCLFRRELFVCMCCAAILSKEHTKYL